MPITSSPQQIVVSLNPFPFAPPPHTLTTSPVRFSDRFQCGFSSDLAAVFWQFLVAGGDPRRGHPSRQGVLGDCGLSCAAAA